MSEDQSEKRVELMSALAEASKLVRAIGLCDGPVGKQRRKAWVSLSALSPDFTWNRVNDLHRGEPRARVSGDELNVLREAAARQRRAADEREQLRALHLNGSGRQREARRDIEREIREALARIARLEQHLRLVDPEFYRDDIDAASAARQQMGEGDRETD